VLIFRTAAPQAVTFGADLIRLRISIPGLGTTSYPLIMAQKKDYFQAEGYDVEFYR
jgi:ABC-type nitrate/sulfonate/bicarbonate transport system substrate-binding protein